MSKFPQQVELIERVKATLNLTDDELAGKVDVTPQTMQKYAAGYQKAGDRLLQLLDQLMEKRRRPENGLPVHAFVQRADERRRDVDLGLPSAQEQLDQILAQGTIDEVRLARHVLDTICRQIHFRQQQPPGIGKPLVLEGPHRLLPALGYIPAGVPQEVIQQANQFIPVPEGKFPEADFALKVQGDSMVDADIHHGDWVVMTTKREPRNGSVVAALCDGETCLKTYVTDGRTGPFLRSENKSYPPRIIPKDEMQIQGVMLGKLPGATQSGAMK